VTYQADLPNPPDLDLLRAKVQGLAETVAANQAEVAALKEDNRRLWEAIKSLTPPVEVPDVLPEPELPDPTPEPEPTPDPIPADLKALPGSGFRAWHKHTHDVRYNNIYGHPVSGTWNWCQAETPRRHRLFIDGGTLQRTDHRGQPFKGWKEYYFKGVKFDGLQWATESNGGNIFGAMVDCDFFNVGEDAIRSLYGHIENVTVHSVKRIPGAHGDTIQWEQDLENAGLVKNVKSTSGQLHGIITRGVTNLVIDGFEHLGPNDGGWSILFRGDAENVTIRNCKLSGGIVFQGEQRNVNIDWATVQQNVPRDQF
jgi:hypothetical protein